MKEVTPTDDSKKAQNYGVRLLTPIESAWLAAVIDGEGSIYISKVVAKYTKRGFIYAPYLGISNSSAELVSRVNEIIGRGHMGKKEEKRKDWSDMYEYKGSASVLRGTLPQVMAHLVIKKEVAKRMLEFLEFVEANSPDGLEEFPPDYRERAESMYLAVKALNRKGPDIDQTQAASPTSFNPNKRKPGNRSKNCRSLSRIECAWLAGVIDGEGSIFLSYVVNSRYRRGFFYRPQLAVSNSNNQFLIEIAQIVGEGTVHRNKKGGEEQKTRWEYVATAGVLRAILPQILHYLVVKRERAAQMLEYFEYIDGNPLWGLERVSPEYYRALDYFYLSLKEKNRKGKRPRDKI